MCSVFPASNSCILSFLVSASIAILGSVCIWVMTLAESFRLLPHTNSYKRDLELKPQRYFPLNSLYITISWWTMGSSVVIPKLSVLIVYQGSNDNRSIFSGQNLSDKAIFGKPKNVQKQIATQKKVHRMTLCIVDIHPHIKFVQTLEHWSSCI